MKELNLARVKSSDFTKDDCKEDYFFTCTAAKCAETRIAN